MANKMQENYEINYLIRCAHLGDEEEFQIIHDEGFRTGIAAVDTWIEVAIRDASTDALQKAAEVAEPHMTNPMLFQNDFDAWEEKLFEEH